MVRRASPHMQLFARGQTKAGAASRRTPSRGAVTNANFEYACFIAGIPAPVRELRFHETRRFRFDYAWPDRMLAIEVEGGIWRKGGGAHSHPLNIKRDIEKGNLAQLGGWTVLRYAPEDLPQAIADIKTLFNIRTGPA